MLDHVRAILSKMSPIPQSEWEEFSRILKTRKLSTDDYFCRAGDDSDEIAFVLKGLVKKIYYTEKGEELIKGFGREADLVGPYADILRGDSARFSIQACEETLLIVCKYAQFKKFYERHVCWQEIGRKAAENLFIERELREYELLSLSARERYEAFQKNFPDLAERLPLKLIAGYLGINPVSLSRIRGKKT